MKRILINSGAFRAFSVIALAVSVLSFSFKGGEGYEIYINSKLVVQKFGNNMKDIQAIQLDHRNANDEITIKYHHCGKVGKSRTITLKDNRNKILKQWSFANTSDASNSMTCKVKDILDLQKKNGSTSINLYYSSSELPEGRLLTSIGARGYTAGL